MLTRLDQFVLEAESILRLLQTGHGAVPDGLQVDGLAVALLDGQRLQTILTLHFD